MAGLFVSLVQLPVAALVGRVDVSRGLVEVLVVVPSEEQGLTTVLLGEPGLYFLLCILRL